ncbi:MAG TPA: hypothetical protein VF339_17230 [Gammaproteobacteria bacterium]
MMLVDVISARIGAIAAALVLGAAALPAVAQDRPPPDVDNLEVTMRLLPEGATRPDAVTRVIELPEALRSRLADEATGGAAGADDARQGAAADLAADRAGLPEDALPRRNDGARTDFDEVARTAAERARGLGRGQGGAAAEPARDAVAAGRDGVAAAAPMEPAAEARDAGRDVSAGARDAAAGARDAAVSARGAGNDVAAAARERARDAAGDARDVERDIAERARETEEDVVRGRPDRPGLAEPAEGRPAVPERPDPGRGRSDRP